MLPALAVIADKSGLHKAFGKKEALRGLGLEVGQGESRVIIGGSGSGKSVILKHIIGIMKPDSGSVFIEDVDITGLKGSKLYEIREKSRHALPDGGALRFHESMGERRQYIECEHARGVCRRRSAFCR
jgi:ABC-type transporter Mla maintaining outer membrane lipid asymmetry ATPase subunit MlaF